MKYLYFIFLSLLVSQPSFGQKLGCVIKLSSQDCKKCVVNLNLIIQDFNLLDVKLDADSDMLRLLEKAGIVESMNQIPVVNALFKEKTAYYGSGLFFIDQNDSIVSFYGIPEYLEHRNNIRFLYNRKIIADTLNLKPIPEALTAFDATYIYQASNNAQQILIQNYQNGKTVFETKFNEFDFFNIIDRISANKDYNYCESFATYMQRKKSPLVPNFFEIEGVKVRDNILWVLGSVFKNDSIGEDHYILRHDHNLVLKMNHDGIIAASRIPLNKTEMNSSNMFDISMKNEMIIVVRKTSVINSSYSVQTFGWKGDMLVRTSKKRDALAKKIERKLVYSKDLLREFALNESHVSNGYAIYPFVGWYQHAKNKRRYNDLGYFQPYWGAKKLAFPDIISLFDVNEQVNGSAFLMKDIGGIKIRLKSKDEFLDYELNHTPSFLCPYLFFDPSNTLHILSYSGIESPFVLYKMYSD